MTSKTGASDERAISALTTSTNVETPSTPSKPEPESLNRAISSYAQQNIVESSTLNQEPRSLVLSQKLSTLTQSDSSDSIMEQPPTPNRSSTVTLKPPKSCENISAKSTSVAQKTLPTPSNSSSFVKSGITDSRASHISEYSISENTIENMLKGKNLSSKEKEITAKFFKSSRDDAVKILYEHCKDMAEVNYVLKELKLNETDTVSLTTTLVVNNAISNKTLPKNLLDGILQRFQDPKNLNPMPLSHAEMKLILHHPDRGKFLGELFKLNKQTFIKFIETGVPFNLDNDLIKETENYLLKYSSNKSDLKSFQKLMSLLHPNTKEFNNLLSFIDKIESQVDRTGIEKLSTKELNTLTLLYDLRPEVFNDLIKNFSSSEKSRIEDHINIFSENLNITIVQQMASLISDFLGEKDKLAVEKNSQALEDFQKLKNSNAMVNIKENFSTNAREKFSISELENSSKELSETKEKLSIISRTLTTSLIDSMKGNSGTIKKEIKLLSLHRSLETIETTIREIERQEEIIFEQQLKILPLKIRHNFQQINNLMGSSPIPLEERIQLLNFLKYASMAEDFLPILDLAISVKAANLKKLEGTLSSEGEVTLNSEIVLLDQKFMDLFSKFFPLIKDEKILTTMNKFIPGFFKAKIGCINTQFTTDSMDFSVQIPKIGSFSSVESNKLSKTTGREIVGLNKAQILAPHYKTEESEFAQNGFVKRDLYNLWNKNIWEPNTNDKGELTSVKWVCQFRIKQKDNSFKKIDSNPVIVDLTSLNLAKDEELAAWQIITEISRGTNLKSVVKIENIPLSIQVLLKVPPEELVAKYNNLLTPEIISKGEAFKKEIELTYASAMIDTLPPPSTKTSKFFKRFSLSITGGASTTKRDSFTATQEPNLTKSSSSLKTSASASYVLKSTSDNALV